MRSLLFLILVLTVVNCAKSPDVPDLNRLRTPAPERIVLDDKLTPKDIRQIFRAMNKDNKLSALKPYLEDSTDAELSDLATLLSKYVYTEAHVPNGVLSLVERRIASKGFSTLAQSTREWAAAPTYKMEVDTLAAVLVDPATPALVSADVAFLAPSWSPLAKKVWSKGEAYAERLPWPKAPSIEASAIVDTSRRIFDAGLDQKITRLAAVLGEHDFAENLGRAMFAMRGRYDMSSFEGLGRGLASMLPSEAEPQNRFERLLNFVQAADTPTGGLFTNLQEQLRADGDLMRVLTGFLQPLLGKSTAGFLKDTLADQKDSSLFNKTFWHALPDRKEGEPSASFRTLLGHARAAVRRVTDDENAAALTAYLVTLQLERIVLANRNSSHWKKAPEENFHQSVWDFPAPTEPILIDAKTKEVTADLKKLDMEGVAEEIAKGVGNYEFFFRPVNEKSTFRGALTSAFTDVDESRRFGNMGTFFRSLTFFLTHPADSAITLQDFECDNLMDGVNRVLAAISKDNWPKFDRLFFETLQLGDLPEDVKAMLLAVYTNSPTLRTRMALYLENIKMVHEFNVSVKGLPSPFETYHALLHATRSEDMHSATAFFSFLGESRFVSRNTLAQPEFPAIYQWFERGVGLPRVLYALSWLEPGERRDFFGPFGKLVGLPSAKMLETHLTLFDRISRSHGPGTVALVDRMIKQAGNWIDRLDELPAEERAFIQRFVGDKDHEILWRWLKARGSRATITKLMGELKTLSRSGYLRESFEILQRLDNERLRRIGAFLKQWEASGELVPFLDTIATVSGN